MEVEARHWFSRPRDGQVLVLISSGEFRTWEDIRDHLLPPALVNNLSAEPLWISLQRRRDRIIANPDDHQLHGELTEDLKQLLLRFYPGHDWDQLRGRERLQRQRARWLVSGVILLLLTLLGTATKFWWDAREQRAQAELQRDTARAQLLSMQARRVDREARWLNDIALAGSLALESIWVAQKSYLAAEPDAIEVVRSTLLRLPLVVLRHGMSVDSLAVLPGGLLAGGGLDGTIKLWPTDGRGQPVVLAHGNGVNSLAVLADGRLASGSSDGTIKVWPKDNTGELVILTHNREGVVMSLAVLADGRLASGGLDGTIKLWPKDGRGEPLVLTHGKGVWSLVVLADGRLASGSDDGTIKVWPQDGRGQALVLTHGKGVNSLVVLPDGRLASGGVEGTIKLWPKDGRGEPLVLLHGKGVNSLVVLPDGRLASGGGGTIKIWPKAGRGEPEVLTHAERVWSLAVLADGRLASGGSDDGTIKLWPKDGRGEPVVLTHGQQVWSLMVMADGRLASGGVDGTTKLWLVNEQKLIAALCLRAGRNLTKDEWARYVGTDTSWQPSCRDLPSNWRTPDQSTE